MKIGNIETTSVGGLLVDGVTPGEDWIGVAILFLGALHAAEARGEILNYPALRELSARLTRIEYALDQLRREEIAKRSTS